MKHKIGLKEEQLYDVLVAPIITEKSQRQQSLNQYTFHVSPKATKHHVRAAVELLYKVTVEDINTLIVKGKTKRFRGRIGHRSDVKKAVVTVKQGQFIDMTAQI